MASSSGLDARTGAVLSDWAHVQQSIRAILTTPVGSRLMRRDFGSRLPNLIDARMTQANVLAVYAESALAIDRWEPRFRMLRGALTAAGADGKLTLALLGIYYPKGHLGDFTVAEDASTRVIFERAA